MKPSPKRRLQRLLAESLYLLRALWTLRWAAFNLVALWCLGALGLRTFGAPPGGGVVSWSEAFFDAYFLMFFEPVAAVPDHPAGQVIQYAMPLLGIVVAAEGLLKLGLTVFQKDSDPERWMETLASTARNHVILCGLGSVGFRVLEELTGLGEQVFAIEQNGDSAFLARARQLGAEVLIGDARAEELLRKLNVARARAVIVATDNDLANLEIAMDVREIRADVPIVLRLFDQRLASKVQKTLGFEVSLSTSRLAAPLFAAAALEPSVVGAHRVGGEVQAVLEIEVAAGGGIQGLTVSEVIGTHRLTVLAVRPRGGDWKPQPQVATRLSAGDRIQVMVRGSEVARVHALNRRGPGE